MLRNETKPTNKRNMVFGNSSMRDSFYKFVFQYFIITNPLNAKNNCEIILPSQKVDINLQRKKRHLMFS